MVESRGLQLDPCASGCIETSRRLQLAQHVHPRSRTLIAVQRPAIGPAYPRRTLGTRNCRYGPPQCASLTGVYPVARSVVIASREVSAKVAKYYVKGWRRLPSSRDGSLHAVALLRFYCKPVRSLCLCIVSTADALTLKWSHTLREVIDK